MSDVPSSSLPVGLGPFVYFGYGGGGEKFYSSCPESVSLIFVGEKNWEQKIMNKEITNSK
jgi:hypothetical protein